MTTTFAEAAAQWCGLSARLLGWRPDDFWNATPAELVMALTAPADPGGAAPPTRETITRMMERDAHE